MIRSLDNSRILDPPEQVRTIREYLLRGGFIYMDDFWGPEEWDRFDESMKLIFPERPIVEIDGKDPIFHAVYDLDDRYQVLGQWSLHGGGGFMAQRAVGTVAHWVPAERHEVKATTDARLVLILAPWPGPGHPSHREERNA